MQSKIVEAGGELELIPLDPNIKLLDVVNYIWIPLNPEWDKHKDQQISLVYSRKQSKKLDAGSTPM